MFELFPCRHGGIKGYVYAARASCTVELGRNGWKYRCIGAHGTHGRFSRYLRPRCLPIDLYPIAGQRKDARHSSNHHLESENLVRSTILMHTRETSSVPTLVNEFRLCFSPSFWNKLNQAVPCICLRHSLVQSLQSRTYNRAFEFHTEVLSRDHNIALQRLFIISPLRALTNKSWRSLSSLPHS